MATPINESSVARLLNLNARIHDVNELQNFINDYFGERDDSQDLSDISDSDDEPEVVESDACEFSPVLNLVELVMPPREPTCIGSSSASVAPLNPTLCACSCKLNDGLPCLSAFDPRTIEDIRMQYLHLHADNCSGQNKNLAMMWYLLWRVMTGRHMDIKLSFLITGHTKFSPDGGFGLIKRRYRKTAVNCLADLADVVTQSSTMNMVQLCGNEAGDVFVPTSDWTAHLSQYFRKLVGIKGFQHFHFRNDGSISAQRLVGTPPIIFNLLKSTTVLPLQGTVAQTIQPSGLDLTRQWYLFDEIRQFVEESCQDRVTPKPNQPKATAPTAAAMDVDEPIEPPPAKARKGKGKRKGK